MHKKMNKKGLGIIPIPFAGKVVGVLFIILAFVFGSFLSKIPIPASWALGGAGIALILF